MEKENSKFGAKQIATTAILLAICIVSQFFKNLSVFITGPIINACLVFAVLMVNLPCGIILSIITPITAWLITGNPLMGAVPGIIPLIMAGNAVLVIMVHFWLKDDMIKGRAKGGGVKSYVKAFVCSLAKGVFMGLTISLWLLPTFLPQESPLRGKMSVFQTTFSLHQFLTACIGFVYVFIIWVAVYRFAVGDKTE